MNIWNDIENKLTKQFKTLFETTPNVLKKPWGETLTLFHQVFNVLLPEGDRLLNNLHTMWHVVDDNERQDALESFVLGFENYVKLTLNYKNPSKYTELENADKSFIHFLLPLYLLPRDKNKPQHEIEEIMQKGYNIRNDFAHNKPELRTAQLITAIEAVTVAYLALTAKYSPILSKAVSVHQLTNLNSYLTKVEKRFKEWQQLFVAIDGHELSYINSRAVERKVVLEAEEVASEITKSIEDWRDELRKDRKGKNRMIIWGGAGTGKSTTLFVLSYEDAKKKLANYANLQLPIPVFLPLNMQDDKATIEESIAKELGVTEEECTLLLQTGSLLLYLDGLNEITTVNNLRGRKEKQLKILLDTYPKTFTILSTRPEQSISIPNSRIFELLPMDDGKIEEFLTKNAKQETTRKTIKKRIELQLPKDQRSTEARRLYQIISTPLFLKFLTDIVDSGEGILDNEGKIVAKFIQGLYDRERIDKSDARVNKDILHKLLGMLGYESLVEYKTNMAMEEDWVDAILKKTKEDYGFNIDINYVLTLFVQLNILARIDDKYTFRHQSYQNYYHSVGEWISLMKENIDI